MDEKKYAVGVEKYVEGYGVKEVGITQKRIFSKEEYASKSENDIIKTKWDVFSGYRDQN